MLRYLRERFLISIPTILWVTVIVFLMLQLVPGDPAEIFLGEHYSTPELLAQVRHDMGLDRPLHIQYLSFLWNALHGDFGRSLHNNRPVLGEIRLALPITVELAVASMMFVIVLGVTMGIISALSHNTWLDTVTMALALGGVSMPIFWLALLLMLLFSVRLRWFPAIGQGSLKYLVLPAIALGLRQASVQARLVRSSMLEVMGEDYVRTARAKGLAEKAVILKHTFRNALIPAVTMLGLQFGQLLSGAVITETVFSRLGIGKLYVEAILNKDFPMIQAVTLLIAFSYVAINLLVDLSYALLDPRIRYD